ncbi:MAG: hypothetical protein OXK78_02580, partial [Caldilineaceae bacterium]|nr:hypothetical protein [Caldilineaceae bacterium]
AALLVIMMIVRPAGILPSARRRTQGTDPDEAGFDDSGELVEGLVSGEQGEASPELANGEEEVR